jgi:hypothetical protein
MELRRLKMELWRLTLELCRLKMELRRLTLELCRLKMELWRLTLELWRLKKEPSLRKLCRLAISRKANPSKSCGLVEV